MCFSRIFFFYFFFLEERQGMIQGVCIHVCAYMHGIFHTGKMATANTHVLQHLHFHKSRGPPQQIQHSVVQGKNTTEVHFLFSLWLPSFPLICPFLSSHIHKLNIRQAVHHPATEECDIMSSLPKVLKAIRYQCVADTQFIRHLYLLSAFTRSTDCKEELANRQSTSPVGKG